MLKGFGKFCSIEFEALCGWMLAKPGQLRNVRHAHLGQTDPSLALASAAVQIEAPKRTRSLIRNCPASPNTGNPYERCRAAGVENKKLTVSKKVMIAPMLPMKESLAEKGRDANSKATTISISPIRLETP